MTVTSTGYFRPADGSKAVGISRATLYRWKSEGRLKTHKVGGMVFFKVADVKSIIDNMGDQMGDQETVPENNSTKTDSYKK